MPTGQHWEAWAAGVFEGEGCVAWAKTQKQPRLSVRMTDRDVIFKFFEVVRLGRMTGPTPNWTGDRGKELWTWQTSTIKDTYPVLELFWPYLHSRRKARAREIIQMYYDNPRIRLETYPYYVRRDI